MPDASLTSNTTWLWASQAMRVFHLQPSEEGLTDPAWRVSWYQGSCRVRAGTAEAARRFANGAFTIAVYPGGVPPGCEGPPWSQPRLVAVQELPGVPADSLGPPGSVVPVGILAPAVLTDAGADPPDPEAVRA